MWISSTAEEVSKKSNQLGIVDGKSPITVAAAAIHLVTQLTEQHKRPLKDIADACGVSEATIKNCYKDMEPRRKELIPADIVPKLLPL